MRSLGILALSLLCLSTFAASRIDNDQLVQLVLGFIEELKFTNDAKKFSPCIKEYLAPKWEVAEAMISATNWKSVAMIVYAFSAFLDPTIGSLAELGPCGAEIDAVYSQIQKALTNEAEFVQKVVENYDIVRQTLQEFVEYWVALDFTQAGKVAGGLIFWIFLN